MYSKGSLVYVKATDGKASIPETSVQRSYCFDYVKLKEQFEINFERAKPDTLSDEEKELKEKTEERDLPFY